MADSITPMLESAWEHCEFLDSLDYTRYCVSLKDSDPNKVTVGEIMARPLPYLDVTVHLDEAYRLLLAGNTGVLAMANGKVVDIVTRIDLVHYWNQMQQKG